MKKTKRVVIGNGMVGHHLLTALAERGGKDQFWPIRVVEDRVEIEVASAE